MSILEVSAASINGSAPIVIFICLVIGALAFIAFIFQESIQKFNKKHNLVNKDNDAVVPASWNKGRDGVDAEGVPYYGLSGVGRMTSEVIEEETTVVCADGKADRHAA